VDKLARTQVLRAASAQELGRATERESASVMDSVQYYGEDLHSMANLRHSTETFHLRLRKAPKAILAARMAPEGQRA